MKNKLSSRDIKIFFLGFFTMVIILIIWDWNSVLRGMNDAKNNNPYAPDTEISK